MGIIDEEKVKQLHRNEWCKVNGKVFISATLAESELQELAIEFAEWISGDNCDWTPSTQCNLWQYKYKIQAIKINSEELFQKFIEQRKTN